MNLLSLAKWRSDDALKGNCKNLCALDVFFVAFVILQMVSGANRWHNTLSIHFILLNFFLTGVQLEVSKDFVCNVNLGRTFDSLVQEMNSLP